MKILFIDTTNRKIQNIMNDWLYKLRENNQTPPLSYVWISFYELC